MKLNVVALFWLTITLLVFSTLIKLGFWQLDRALEKEARMNQMQIWQQEGGQSLEQAFRSYQQSPKVANDLLIQQQGRFDGGNVFLLDNQTDQGQLGFRVLQVLETSQHSVLVNLGWVKGDRTRQTLPSIEPITGIHQISGSLRVVEPGILLAEQQLTNNKGKVIIQQIEIDKISRLINQQLLPFVVYLDKNEAIGYKKNWQPIVMSPQKHRGYAFQWFALATAWLILMVVAAIKYKNNKA